MLRVLVIRDQLTANSLVRGKVLKHWDMQRLLCSPSSVCCMWSSSWTISFLPVIQSCHWMFEEGLIVLHTGWNIPFHTFYSFKIYILSACFILFLVFFISLNLSDVFINVFLIAHSQRYLFKSTIYRSKKPNMHANMLLKIPKLLILCLNKYSNKQLKSYF